MSRALHLTVGLPRSGKSTWAQGTGWPVVNPDSIRLALHGQPFVGEAEPVVWMIARYMVDALFLAGHTDVVLDATNVTKRRRDEWKRYKCELHIVPTPPDVCVRRAIETGQQYLVPVIQRMAQEWDLPLPWEPWRELKAEVITA